MTSTEFTIGLEAKKPSSKVLKPPGGGASDIFGLGATTPATANKKNTRNSSDIFGLSSAMPATANKNSALAGTNSADSGTAATSSNTQTSILGETQVRVEGRKCFRNLHRNPITGEEIDYSQKSNANTLANENQTQEIEKDENKNGEPEKQEPEKEAPPRVVQTSIRVKNPPGGKSSGIF